MSRINERYRAVRAEKPVQLISMEHIGEVIETLLRTRAFWLVTLLGNTIVFGVAFLLFHFEHGVNPALHSYLDAVYWGICTVTTVGYGDVSPVTQHGKLVAIGLMISGSTMWMGFTATFASIVLSSRLGQVEDRVERALHELEDIERSEVQSLQRITRELQAIAERRRTGTNA